MLFGLEITSNKFKAVKKSLRVSRRFEPFEFLFPLSNNDMRVLDAIVQPFAFDMLRFRESLRHNRPIEPKPISSNDGGGFILAKEL